MHTVPSSFDYLSGTGETGKLIAQHFSAGRDQLPGAFHASLAIVLHTPTPAFLVWGSNNLLFYNEAFIPVAEAAGHHPHSICQDLENTWPALWETISRGEHGPGLLLPGDPAGKQWQITLTRLGGNEGFFGVLTESPSPGSETARRIDAENKLNDIIRLSPIPASVFRGPDFIIEKANAHALALWGKDESIIGHTIAEVFPELKDTAYMQLLHNVYHHGLEYEGIENPAYLVRQGIRETVYVTFIYKPLRDHTGQTDGVLCMGYDVTEHVEAKEKLKAGEARNQLAVTAGRLGTFDLDVTNDTLTASDRFYEIFGVEKGTSERQRMVDAIHPDDRLLREEAHRRGMETGELFYEARLLMPDGSVRWMSTNARYLRDEQNRPVRLVGVVQDITALKNHDEQIEKAERKFRETVQHAPIGIAMFTGQDYVCEMANDAYLDLVDKLPDEFIGKKISDTLPEVMPEVGPLFGQLFETGESIEATEFEVTLKRHNRLEHAFFNFVYQPVKNDDGSVNGVLVIASEVTQQVKSRHAIQERERNFGNMVMQSPIAMTIFRGPDYVIDVANDELVNQIWRRKREEVIGRKALEVFPELNDQKYPALLERVLKEGITHREKESPAYIQGDDGMKLFYLDFEYSPLHEPDGSIGGIMITVSDVTERVEARKKVEDAEARMRIAVEGTGTATWDLNLENRELIHSPRLAEIFGHPVHLMLRHEDLLGQVLEEDRLNILEPAFERAMKTGIYSYEARIVHTDSSIRWIRTNGKVIFDESGKPLRMLGTMNDITGRKEDEKRSLQLAAIVESSDDAIISKTMNGTVTSFNRAAERLFGYAASEIIGNNISMLFPPGYEAEEARIISRLKAGERVDHFETIRKHKSGRLIDVSLTISPLRDSKGNIIGASKIARDITEQKRIAHQMKETQEQLQIVIEASELGTWELNLQTGALITSERYLEITGGSQLEDPTYEQLKKLIHPDDLPSRDKAFAAALASGTLHYETRLVWPDRTVHWVEVRGKVSYDKDNKPVKMIGTIRDLTEERTYQSELQESEQKFRLLADSMPQLIWTSDERGRILYFNQSVYDYSGQSPDQLAEGGWINIVHPDDRSRNLAEWTRSISSGKPFLSEHRFRRFDGEYRWQLSRAIPQRDAYGNIQQWVGTSTDIHEQKTFVEELEYQVKLRTRELNKANEDLLKSNDELAQFAYVASHDLQEPLRKIQTFSNRIMDSEGEKLSERGQDYFRRIQSTSQRMQQLIIDLLSFSRANTTEKHFELTDLNVVLQTVKDQLRESIQARQARITSDRLPEASVIVFQFEQLLTNIISNAIKFSKPGINPEIRVSYSLASEAELEAHHLDPGRAYHHLAISDNGIGFSDEYRDRIFQVFQRLHGRDKFEGTGIGLAIVKKIAENHYGTVSAHGVENEGAVFHLYFPVENNEAG